MTEAEWLASTDPQEMLFSLREQTSERKTRLFAVACCRSAWHPVTDWRCRRALELAERVADGKASLDELAEAREAIKTGRKVSRAVLVKHAVDHYPAIGACNTLCTAWRLARADLPECAGSVRTAKVALKTEADLVRDIFGNPFRTVSILPAIVRWNDSTVVKLAQAIYEERRFGDLPILADALEEAGCTDPVILDHCRSGGEHVLGCWSVDLLLGKN
jgi:hypothetical protein